MDDRLTAIDRALAEALDVSPSPDFVARIRQRVASEPQPLPFWRGWRVAIPALAATLAIGVGIATILPRRHAIPPTVLPARTLARGPLPPAGFVESAPVVTIPAETVAGRRSRVAMPSRSALNEADVLIPREELEMYQRLIAAAQKVPKAMVVQSPTDVVAVREISEITIDPLKIEPIIAPPEGGEGVRR